MEPIPLPCRHMSDAMQEACPHCYKFLHEERYIKLLSDSGFRERQLAQIKSEPSTVKKVANVTRAATQAFINALRGQPVLAEPEEQKRRISVCASNSCGFYVAGVCKHRKCGCPVTRKTKLASEKCPVNLW